MLYYKRQIESQIHRIGRWVFEPTHKNKKVDTNASESFNCVLKRLQEWREVPVDVIVHGCERLCRFYDMKIQRGRYDLGSYRLRPQLNNKYCRAEDKVVFSKVVAPEDIVTYLRKGLSEIHIQVEF